MDLEACIAERKAIKDLTLDPEFKEISSDGKIYLLHVVENLSDFKDGESVCLCRQDNNRLICEENVILNKSNTVIKILYRRCFI